MKILFAGSPALAAPCLDSLARAGHEVAVLTNPDARIGRSGAAEPSPVKAKALELGKDVFQPEKLDQAFRDLIAGRFELLVSFAFGRIFGPKFLALFPRGGLNVHPSLLPRWRGPSPLSAVILAGDSKTGICVQTLAAGMDEGDIVVKIERDLDGTETTGSLTAWAAGAAPDLLTKAVALTGDGLFRPEPQVGEPTYCGLLQKEDGRLDWKAPSAALEARVRAYDPWPGAFTTWKGQTLAVRQARAISAESALGVRFADKTPLTAGKVVALDKSEGILVQTGEGFLALREVQLAGKKPLEFGSFANGTRDFLGSVLGEQA